MMMNHFLLENWGCLFDEDSDFYYVENPGFFF
jgi:hypothetical protein